MGTPYTRASDQYLTQRVMGASPEQLVALLLEGGQRFLSLAIQAMGRKDYAMKGLSLNKVLAILEELTLRLNHEDGGDLAINLMRIYDWWGREILASGAELNIARLERISRQMGEMREAWEQSHQKRLTTGNPSSFHAADLVG